MSGEEGTASDASRRTARAGAAGAAPVMADVARLAGVSQKTVSRVVNDAPHVRGPVRDRVNAAIAELGYRPNAAARALVTQRSRVIGVVTPGTALYGPSAQLVGVERAAWQAGYRVVISSTVDASSQELVRAVRELLDHGVDGVVVASPVSTAAAPADLLRGVAAVSLDPVQGELGRTAVMVDQRSGARAVVEHLLALGHRTVWHVSGPPSWHAAAARRDAWRDALTAAGAPVPEPWVGDWSARAGYAAGLELAARPEVTAIFAANDQMALGVMRALFERGRRIPQDVSVAGFDDIPEAEYLQVPLTTVRLDFDAMARRAVAELLAAIRGDGPAGDAALFGVDLIVRASTGPAPDPSEGP
ncbi:MAG TPA: LacI family DNA-binding transcriptional regulator [Actinotalea sp.]|nr:LacI family DNA-binding transcriptional regulator [Actinotalea sp.]